MPPGLPPAPTSEHHEHGHNSRKSWENTCVEGVQELDARERRAACCHGLGCWSLAPRGFFVLYFGAIQRFVFLGNERLGCCQGFQHHLVLLSQKLP